MSAYEYARLRDSFTGFPGSSTISARSFGGRQSSSLDYNDRANHGENGAGVIDSVSGPKSSALDP